MAWAQDDPATPEPTPAHSMGMGHDKPNYLMTSADMGSMEVWDVDSQMAMPFPMAHMPMSMLMLDANAFFRIIAEEGVERGRATVDSSNMLMADLGTSLGEVQYLNLDVMLTAELWTLCKSGTPELLQIGEAQADGTPFIDAQHPHSSPLMGLTLSDTLALDGGDKSYLKVFFAPRGESTDGPIPFMHRITGEFNPDVPLGHHIGQDVGHISSTVLGGSLKLGGFHLEGSTFHGMEPSPTQVDLPLGTMDSYAVRLIQEISPQEMAMISYAYVLNPEPGIANATRVSASLYAQTTLTDTWKFHVMAGFGWINNIDNASNLASIIGEGLLTDARTHVFVRVENLERTPNELGIPGLPNPDTGRWVTAITVGYSHQLLAWDGWELNCGASATNDQVPSEYQAAYAGNPFTYKFFFQLGGSQMDHL